MKKLLILFIFLVSHGLLASTSSPLLLESKTSGGYVPREMLGHMNGVRIYDDGLVISYYKKNFNTPEVVTNLAILTKVTLNNIKKTFRYLNEGELELVNPEGPLCEDAPDTFYKAYKNNNLVITFASWTNCRDALLKNTFYESKKLRDLLKSFSYFSES